MTTAYTSLLGLALPVTGELSGTWGDVVNNSITSLLDSAIAGTTNVSTDADVTLTTTTGAANTAREAILLFSGARTALRTVTAPAQSKIYTVINATTGGYAVKLVGAGPTTGINIPNGASVQVSWNGSDFVFVGPVGSFVNGNFAAGTAALAANTTGTDNTAVGYQALIANTTASSNAAFGAYAAIANTTGVGVTAIGAYALYSNTTGEGNVAVGTLWQGNHAAAMYANTTGNVNTAVGSGALRFNTTGSNNTAHGGLALYNNTTASNNTAVGHLALTANTTGTSNTAVGQNSLRSVTTNSDNAAFGTNAARDVTGSANSAFGSAALIQTTTGAYNVAVGQGSLFSNTTANNNTAVGYQAGYSVTTNAENTYIGAYSGKYGTGAFNVAVGTGSAGGVGFTGTANVVIGNNAGSSLTSGSYNLFIGARTGSATYSGGAMTTGSANTIIGSYSGNQNGLDIRTSSNNIVLSDGNGTPRIAVNNSGWFIAPNSTTAYFGLAAHVFAANVDQGTVITQILTGNYGGQNIARFYGVTSEAGANAGGTAMVISKNGGTSRSINAAGTINASGADYAEYMVKDGTFTVAKGDVVGINAQGQLTNVFANAISFIVKSTDPSYVGGDSWGTAESIGVICPEPPKTDATDEEKAQYEADKAVFDAALEAARQTVDRVAFAGQVPVNVMGATAGQYIIPVNDNGSIKGEAVSNPTFEQYQSAVGKVIAIEADGRARIIVKVA
jgi:hypothetical protein